MRRIGPLLVFLALGACHKADNAPGPGGVTAGEDRALDEAAQMVESRQLPSDAVPQVQPSPSVQPTAGPKPKP